MQKTFVVVCLLMSFQPALAQDSETEKKFRLVKEDDNILIYERWITFPESDPPFRAREVRGDFKVNTTVSEALALIKNEKLVKEWQDHVSEFRIYETEDTTRWLEYSYHDIPWPVSDQDHLLEYRIEEGSTPDSLVIRFQTKVDDSLEPVREDVTRMHLYGAWVIRRNGHNGIYASYRILSKPSGIPRIFTDPIIRNNLMSTIREYIRILEKK